MHILQWIASPMKNGISTRIHSYNGGYIIFQSLKQVKINQVRLSRSKPMFVKQFGNYYMFHVHTTS